MSTSDQPTEDELRAAYEAELKKIRVEQIVLEQVVSLINLGMRRTGLSPGTENERDLGQVRMAIDAVRALMSLIEQTAPAQAGAVRDALSQMQLAYVRLGGAPPGAGGPDPAAAGSPPSDPVSPQGAQVPPQGAQAPPRGAPTPGPDAAPPPSPAPGEPETPKPGEAGPAQRSGRLWVPGQ
jgi:hypothetical protein